MIRTVALGCAVAVALLLTTTPPAAPGEITEPQLGAAPRLIDALGAQSPMWEPSGTVAAIGLAVDTTSRADIVRFFNTVYAASQSVPIAWTGDYAACVAGTTSQAYQEATVLRVNYYRAMAGLPAAVVLDPVLNTKAQAAALIMGATGSLSHHPPPTWTCYSAEGAQAASQSNLALGVSGPAAIDLYIDDPGAGNFFVGHRRWILYPPQVTLGTGSTAATPFNSAANALWVLGPFGARPQPRAIAWPPHGFVPYQVLPRWSQRWSLSYPGADFSQAIVTMSSGGVPVSLSIETLENTVGYGDNTLVWRPSGIPAGPPATDLTYAVAVNNVVIAGVPTNFVYQVTIIDPAVASESGFEPYDAFAGPVINPDLWYGSSREGDFNRPSGELVRTLDGGQLRLGLVSHGDSAGDGGMVHAYQGLAMRDLGTKGGARFIVGVAASVTVLDADVQDCPTSPEAGRSSARAQLTGAFFNDGTTPGPDDATGNIVVEFQLQQEADGRHRVSASLLRCMATSSPSAACSAADVVSIAGNPRVFTSPWSVGTPVALKLVWQPAKHRFKLTATSAQHTEKQFLSYAGTLADSEPVRGLDFKEVRVGTTVTSCTGSRPRALIEALIDNVKVKRNP